VAALRAQRNDDFGVTRSADSKDRTPHGSNDPENAGRVAGSSRLRGLALLEALPRTAYDICECARGVFEVWEGEGHSALQSACRSPYKMSALTAGSPPSHVLLCMFQTPCVFSCKGMPMLITVGSDGGSMMLH
jgi:hypothetical protein